MVSMMIDEALVLGVATPAVAVMTYASVDMRLAALHMTTTELDGPGLHSGLMAYIPSTSLPQQEQSNSPSVVTSWSLVSLDTSGQRQQVYTFSHYFKLSQFYRHLQSAQRAPCANLETVYSFKIKNPFYTTNADE